MTHQETLITLIEVRVSKSQSSVPKMFQFAKQLGYLLTHEVHPEISLFLVPPLEVGTIL